MSKYLEFQNVSKIYHGQTAVDDVSFSVEEGEFICLIGTSGSGKTTTMRMINRMLNPTKGKVLLEGKDVTKMDPIKLRRRIGYVIQNIGLMPHMTIRKNITMVPNLLKWSQVKQDAKALELIKLVELPEEYLDRYPGELSGGQQQRIGVVRALAADQKLILMDEPFGALDPITREALQVLVKNLQEKLGKTIIFVTHDMDEALDLSTKIGVMDAGELIQFDTPANILAHPANDFVAELLGHERLLAAQQNSRTVGQIMKKNPIAVSPGKSLREAVTVMRKNHVDTLLVTDDDQHLKGYVDIEDIDISFKTATSVSDVMHKGMFYVKSDMLVRDTVERILKRGASYVPVVDNELRLTGIVTRSSLVDMVYSAIWGDENEEATPQVEPSATVEVSDD
ncbi:ATP-binding cassette domain-containing protein [Periweissella cryptocerci]|uniref:Quaternary amine transport ATP-binding protein n=1 Tax=Periweissella cryptocerci TaxID=2506420 RepID=A0A4P6YUW4_9LACO|nr:betaine/proline/choline family ABC transporter ATP-binding protein [Periweissella cryptocerci]QBO36552.1 ATP-binding cassette domain-containing protein [Periweissella cryptocerci]